MDINELPSPQFVINEAGLISVFLPAFEGEPATPVLSKKDEFLAYINATEFDMLVLAVTDIINEGSYLIYKGEDKVISEAFGVDASQGVFAEGVVSRKKQLVPKLTDAVKNM